MRQIQMGIDRLPQTWYKEILTQPPVVIVVLSTAVSFVTFKQGQKITKDALSDSMSIKCEQWLGPRLYEAGHQKDEGSATQKAKTAPCIQVHCAFMENTTNITPQRYNRFTCREGRDWTLIRKDNGIRVNARWWDAEWDPTASCSEWTLATYTAA
ncbi:hypothetical protein T4D_15362 [Trichinella pseudospiralis]|uniref:Uncharacterized protein n=1 Tax=Trichinella pseudospiralis TaxID=6337 RepID=A0A0V1FC11_TRIPS|nr:hypothetical protein T4D_15362 [Trichinella pseudospiralis]